MKCPYCQNASQQTKAGRNVSGTQRYRCGACQKNYTPEPKVHGYDESIRYQAVRMYVDGINFRRIGRQLGVNHQSVVNWVRAYVHQLPDAPVPKTVDTLELDELFTFVEQKKTKFTS